MNPLRIGVVGGGRLGSIHARLLADVEGARLAAIVEPDAAARMRLAEQHQVPVLENFQDAFPLIDAAIVAAPTFLHEPIGLDLLRRGVSVLMEKPLAHSPEAAARLCEAARQGGCVLQVGHVERFNPAVQAVLPRIRGPRFTLGQRTSGYTFRSTDVGVVLDLMIHDIDIVLALHAAPVKEVRAVGAAVIGPHEDWAHAQLLFEDDSLASLTASRVQGESTRRMHVAGETCLADLDFSLPQARLAEPGAALRAGELRVDQLTPEQLQALRDGGLQEQFPVITPELPKTNAILEEQRDFVRAIRSGGNPQVTGADGLRAVEVADRILRALHRASTELPHVIPLPQTPWSQDRKAG